MINFDYDENKNGISPSDSSSEESKARYTAAAASAETSLISIKKQLLVVETLRSELCNKEDIIYSLNQKIIALEKDDLLSSEYFHENIKLHEKVQYLEKLLDISNSEKSSVINKLNIQSHLNENLNKEIYTFSDESKDARNKFEYNHKEGVNLRIELKEIEEKLKESKDMNHELKLKLRQTELLAGEWYAVMCVIDARLFVRVKFCIM